MIWREFWAGVLSMAFVVGTAGNLAAAVLWAAPALVHLHAKLDRHHAERVSSADLEPIRAAIAEMRMDQAKIIQAITGRLG